MKKKIDRSRGMQSLQIACKQFIKYLVISKYFYIQQRWGRTMSLIMDINDFLLSISPLSDNLKLGRVSQYTDKGVCKNDSRKLICVANKTGWLVLIRIFNASFS